MLTANQLILLGAVVSAPQPRSTEALASWHNDKGQAFGDDAARNCMARLEGRGLVVGSGRGRAKTWAPTPQGAAAHQELAPAATSEPDPDPDSNPEKGPRTYVVLEQCSLADAVREALPDDIAVPDTVFDALASKLVYDRVFSPEARNTEHALRQTAKAVYGGADPDDPPMLIAVAGKMWKPTPVKLNNRQTVSIGS